VVVRGDVIAVRRLPVVAVLVHAVSASRNAPKATVVNERRLLTYWAPFRLMTVSVAIISRFGECGI